jgi:ADP-ribosylglycohydrolase
VTFISGVVSATGALAGLAIGDAMGAPFEGGPPQHVPLLKMHSGGPKNRIAGHYTDDTLQAIAVAKSLLCCRAFRPDDVIWRLIEGYRRFPEFYGPTSGAVFELVMSGVPVYRAAEIVHEKKGGSRSNGSVMRGPPVGIFFSGPAMREISLCCSRLTHVDPVAGECSAWVNQMISDMCRGYSRSRAFERALMKCHNEEVSRMLGDFNRYDPEPALDALLCTHAALTVFMEGASFQRVISRAISLGGDTDTVGAVAGALAGAWAGIGAIPPDWLYDLQDSETIIMLGEMLWMASL